MHSYPARAAELIRQRLTGEPAPATDLLTEMTGQQVRIRPGPPKRCWLTEANQRLLRCYPQAAWGRNGALVAEDGTVLAATRLILLPGRLPEGALEEIEAGTSCGTVLGPHGMTRQDRRAALTGSSPAVIASAVLMLDEAAGLSYELITVACCRLVAAKSVLVGS